MEKWRNCAREWEEARREADTKGLVWVLAVWKRLTLLWRVRGEGSSWRHLVWVPEALSGVLTVLMTFCARNRRFESGGSTAPGSGRSHTVLHRAELPAGSAEPPNLTQGGRSPFSYDSLAVGRTASDNSDLSMIAIKAAVLILCSG